MIHNLLSNTNYWFSLAIILTIIGVIIFLTIGIIQLISEYLQKFKVNYDLKQIEENNLYISQLEQNYNDLRRFKHDYKNLLLSLSASIENNASQTSINNILKSINVKLENNTPSPNEQALQIQDELIRGIVTTKLINADRQQIETITDIQPNMPIDSHYSVQITRILGIFLDNAIEASLKAEHPQISFTMKNQQIIVQNTTAPHKIDLKRIYASGYSTKAEHSGLGLATVKKIINKYPEFNLQTTWGNNRFTITLTMNTKKESA